jgi:hypothetical protein
MAKKKITTRKTITKKLKPAKPKKKVDPNVLEEYEETITFECPIRGLVTQKVKVKKYRSEQDKYKAALISKEEEFISSVEGEDDGLSIYSEEDMEKDAPLQTEEE